MLLLLPFYLVKLLSFISVRVYPNANVAKLEILIFNKKQIFTYGLTKNLVVNMSAQLLICLND